MKFFPAVDDDQEIPERSHPSPVKFDILLLGEGDFSFTRALCRIIYKTKLNKVGRMQILNSRLNLDIDQNLFDLISIVSTSFDSLEEVKRKYSGAANIIEEIREIDKDLGRIKIIDNINACELKNDLSDRLYDVIIWNHPHLGVENCTRHKFLIIHLFHSAKQVLSKHGRINISLVNGQEERWKLLSEVLNLGFTLETKIPFFEDEWSGYICRRNKSGDSFKNSRTRSHYGYDPMQSYMYQFVLGTQTHPDIPISLRGSKNQVIKERKTTADCVISEVQPFLTPRKRQILESIPKDLICRDCKKQFGSARAYTQHNRSVHELLLFGKDYIPNSEPSIPCVFNSCVRKFRKDSDLSDHIISKHFYPVKSYNSYTDSRPQDDKYKYYPCEVCGQAVSCAPGGMEDHINSLKPVMCLSLKCKICSKSFIEARSLEQHTIFCNYKHCIKEIANNDSKTGYPILTHLNPFFERTGS